MGKCATYSGKKKTKFCTSDFDKLLTVQTRSLMPPTLGGVDFDENFEEKYVTWGKIETTRGSTYFDGVDVEREITHKIYIRYLPNITAQHWIVLDEPVPRRLDILDVENIDERGEYTLLRCADAGKVSKVATSA